MSIEGIDRHSIADAVSTHDPFCFIEKKTKNLLRDRYDSVLKSSRR